MSPKAGKKNCKNIYKLKFPFPFGKIPKYNHSTPKLIPKSFVTCSKIRVWNLPSGSYSQDRSCGPRSEPATSGSSRSLQKLRTEAHSPLGSPSFRLSPETRPPVTMMFVPTAKSELMSWRAYVWSLGESSLFRTMFSTGAAIARGGSSPPTSEPVCPPTSAASSERRDTRAPRRSRSARTYRRISLTIRLKKEKVKHV